MGIRQLQKQATRERVLGVARELFEEVGYEAATIRLVAERAGVSVGSVFTSFAGKAELLYQVMADRMDGLLAELERVAPHLHGHTVDRLRSIMAVHYGHDTRRLHLVIAFVAASFSGAPGSVAPPPIGANDRLAALLKGVLLAGVDRGEVRPEADLDGFVDALMGCYYWNYRLTFVEDAAAADLIAMMDRQIGALFAGVSAA